jgi:hypothetical protein
MSTGTTERTVARLGGASAIQNLLNTYIAFADPTGTITDYQQATISSIDSDGFTLSWTKVGSPTGTLNLNILAFK